MQITVTPDAATYIRDQLKITDPLRLALVKSGCSGWSFTLASVATRLASDITIISNGVTIVVLQRDAHDLDGTVIEMEKHLAGASLRISNPKYTSSCGCGKSFTKNP